MSQRAGKQLSLQQIVSDLLIGGVDPGDGHSENQTPQEKLTQAIKQALVQPNRTQKLYEYSPPGRLTNIDARDITVWLADDVGELPKKKVQKKG
ncbi:MAG: hypothetical protein JWQ87_5441 [Candidatus Sulfotelmatobacter sp.]|nr:hypothetical protein [Candidatus Sulfotelmatobacter sp.]